MKEAMYYKKLKDNIVQCQLCPRYCTIKPEEYGNCNARKNIKGTLYSMVYPNIAGPLAIDPIEKKPLYHFLPGSRALSFGTPGCNLHCKHCQNWQISQFKPEEIFTEKTEPKKIVEAAIKNNCQSISYTYTEPTIFFEYMLETAKLAKKEGIKNVIVSNGFINPEPQRELLKYIDAANIDYKGNNKFYHEQCGAWLKPVQETMIAIKKAGKWLEITTLIIPTLNDNMVDIKEMINFVLENLGTDVPWHFTAYFPAYRATQPPTPSTTLLEVRKLALDSGIKYVYAGNIPSGETNSTYCPKCKKILIERVGFYVEKNNVKNSKCSFCKTDIAGVFE
ncbi:AmmeMemoRadiSam system radical SAM enzyme [Candidatus Woesearchaeota archaeon]|nr:MAG: AmmeMemoRadiSam system radical SAM enzyme [Candidatus Woesearchaeota archaeon]